MSKEIAKKLIEHDQRFDKIEESMATKADMNQIMTTLDAIARNTDKTSKEVTAINHRTKRMEDWINESSRKNKVPYNP